MGENDSIHKFINISINEQNSHWTFLFDQTSNELDATEELANNLISALQSDTDLQRRMGYEGEKMIAEIVNRLTKCKEHYKAAIARQRSITDEVEFDKNVNFI